MGRAAEKEKRKPIEQNQNGRKPNRKRRTKKKADEHRKKEQRNQRNCTTRKKKSNHGGIPRRQRQMGRLHRSHRSPRRLLFYGRCLQRSPVSRWAAVGFGAGVGVGAAYTECSRIFEGSPATLPAPKVASAPPPSPKVVESPPALQEDKTEI
ncbi:hypothetical protein LINPERPRIM_LOCUS4535 [Linum perenne]